MVEKRCAYNGRALGHPSGERYVLIAGRRVPGWVVVHQHHGTRGLTQGGTQHIAHPHVQPMDSARGHAPGCA